MDGEIAIWRISDDKLERVPTHSLAARHKEADLERWLENNCEILGKSLAILGRQIRLPDTKDRVDLLAVNESGRLVIIELKRQQTTRDTIAQILDYSSNLDGIDIETLFSYTGMKTAEEVSASLAADEFDIDLTSIYTQEPELIIVAPSRDESVTRIVKYLEKRAKLPVEVVSFTYSEVAGTEILTRTLSSPTTALSSPRGNFDFSKAMNIAASRGIDNLFSAFREFNKVEPWEQFLTTNGGTVRYWVRTINDESRVLFGLNLGGNKYQTPEGQLDVWIRRNSAMEYAGIQESDITSTLGKFPVFKTTKTKFILRISSLEQAQRLTNLFLRWDDLKNETLKGHESL